MCPPVRAKAGNQEARRGIREKDTSSRFLKGCVRVCARVSGRVSDDSFFFLTRRPIMTPARARSKNELSSSRDGVTP